MSNIESDLAGPRVRQVTLRKKRPIEQRLSSVKKMCPSLESDCLLEAPTTQLDTQKSELDQSQKRDVEKPGQGLPSDQDRQEHRPVGGSVHGKLSSSSVVHSELLAPSINFTNNHKQQNTMENRICTTNPKEYLKVPVVRLTRFNIQPETEEEESTEETEEEESKEETEEEEFTEEIEEEEFTVETQEEESTEETQEEESTEEIEEEESTEECDGEQHHDQALQKTYQQEDQRVSISYRSLKAIWGKQPVVKLYRFRTPCEREERQQLRDLDSELNVDQVPSAENSDTVYLKLPTVKPNHLNTERKKQLESQVTDESDSEDDHDPVQLSDKSPLSVQPEDHEEQTMDDSESDQFEEADLKKLSPYELERLKNIKANSKFLTSLKLSEVTSLFRRRRNRLLVKRKKSKSDLVMRRSIRLKVITPPSGGILETRKPHAVSSCPDIPRDPIKMFPLNDIDLGAWSSFKDTWQSISNGKVSKPRSLQCRNLSSYAKSLASLTLEEKSISKILPGSVSTIAIHPSNTQTLVAAGDIYGYVGLWDVKRQSAGAYLFQVHSRTTNSIAFSPSNSQHLLSLGCEGTIRCGDITCSVFDEIYHEPGCRLTSFDFLSDNGSVLLVSHSDSKLSVVDRRTRTDTYDARGSLGLKYVTSVNVHPLRRDLCVVAGFRNALIYDVRKLSKDLTQPVMALHGHCGRVFSASFSPHTGKRILTYSYKIRVFNVNDFDHDVKPIKSFSSTRNLDTMCSMPVTWDPKQENCFCEAIKFVRKINFFHVKGQCVHTLSTPYLPVGLSVLAMHPTRSLLVAGNKGGVLCVCKKSLDPCKEN